MATSCKRRSHAVRVCQRRISASPSGRGAVHIVEHLGDSRVPRRRSRVSATAVRSAMDAMWWATRSQQLARHGAPFLGADLRSARSCDLPLAAQVQAEQQRQPELPPATVVISVGAPPRA